ncbi:diguanylate cyclase [Vibrio sp. HA2012]|uniref:ammonium transporter n=1 Tax=Vibrio sp. HA2012 TaxID=1971595 RepID=UPI000C2CA57C|nr:ammonium transporter [Vibrio sp. HA2012]PJC86249.1 diguanylate cyclase [Vibrio sp. HA2012]
MDNYFWLLTAALLVFVMQAGFLCLESGRIRSKNSINVAAKNIADFVISIIIFWLFGFSIMFGDSFHGLLNPLPTLFDDVNHPWNVSFFLFQLMFCGTATTIMSGAVAERMSFKGYLLIAMILSAFIYPVTGHWAWAGAFNPENPGWLQTLGFVDFAGSMVVHGVGGCVSLVIICIIGPRIGRFDKGVTLPQGSNLPLSALGTLLLWFGWFGFNGGSTLFFNAQVPMVILNTCLAAAWGGLTASAVHYFYHRHFDVAQILNGVIGGLVGITAGCHVMNTPSAMLVGILSGCIVFWGEKWINHLKIDDALGVVPAHLFTGIWGVLSVGLLGDLDKIGTGLSRTEQITVQLFGIICISTWSILVSYTLAKLINRYSPLRVSQEAEEQGMNVAEHHAATELSDLLTSMKHQQDLGDFSSPVPEHPFTEVGLVATQYNKVIKRVQTEISARDEAIDNFQTSEQRKSAILDSSMDSIVTLDLLGNILEFNSSAERTFDTPRIRAKGNNFINIFVPASSRSYVHNSLEHGFVLPDGLLLNRRNSLILQRNGGNEFPAEISVTYSRQTNHARGEYVLNIRDVTRQRKLQAKLRQLAYSDPLTGLYNRTYLVESLNKYLTALKSTDDTLVVFFLDLDKFKRINDTMGHKAGDELLCEVARRLSSVTRESDVITRWGGDEFIILMRGQITQILAQQKAEEILTVMRQPVVLEGQGLNIPTSIGVTMTRTPDIDPDKLIQQADIAMYQAKLQGRDNYQFFADQMAQQASQNFHYEQALREDLHTERFFLVYQPKVTEKGKIIGFEALSRWSHERDGFIPPDTFIAIAEESQLIVSLGKRVIQLTLQFLQKLQQQGAELVPISVNISGKHLLCEEFLPSLRAQLEHTGISGQWLEIEITESVLVSDIERCAEVMSQVKELGIAISIDDFGTGYSSLNYLKRLPIDVLKIDKSFVDECHILREDGKICSTIISLAQNLELTTIAEGVETSEQLSFLLKNGCQYFQGYYFYMPLLEDEVETLLIKHIRTE